MARRFGAAAVLFFGFLQARDAPLDVFPGVRPPIVEVQTIALGNTSTEVEELITIPIEDALNGIEGLDKCVPTRSSNSPRSSSISSAEPTCIARASSCRSAWQA